MVDLSKMTKWDMGKLFDFSVLPKQSTEADIRRGCQIAKEYNCKAFCFSSSEWTPIVAEELKEQISWSEQRSDSHLASSQVQLRLLRQLKRYV